MSLKRRNIIAFLLIILTAVCWVSGQQLLRADEAPAGATAPTLMKPTGATTPSPITRPTTAPGTYFPPSRPLATGSASTGTGDSDRHGGVGRMSGLILCLAAVIVDIVLIFILYQKSAIFGPDGIALLLTLPAMVYPMARDPEAAGQIWPRLLEIARTTLMLISARELFGWVLARFSLQWYLSRRSAGRCARARVALLVSAGWILLPLLAVACFLMAGVYEGFLFGFAAAAVLSILCLWRYGADLDHFQEQLASYRQGQPITVGNGAFAQTEAQLQQVQKQHEQAIRTAVTSERFKVELIANVSHDLRTPLTAILGYSELLQEENLTPAGQEQLRRLHQKAGYMKELVESLFELTRVSSGVAACNMEQIDLIRLLEQTIGLFDDQLQGAELVVRRSYCADTLPVLTDGARMHQVFANLLGNAIKYALAGTRIYLEVKQNPDCCFIRMMNTASYEMDFDPEQIVQRFARGDQARSTKGSGLGLAIAQTYTESVGGTFRVCVDGDQFSAIVELPKTERNP